MEHEKLTEQAKRMTSVEELLAFAGQHGVMLTQEQAKEAFEKLHSTGELADEELDNVAGGGCGGKDKPQLSSARMACPVCGRLCRDGYIESNYSGFTTVIFQCTCGKSFRGVYLDGGSYAEDI